MNRFYRLYEGSTLVGAVDINSFAEFSLYDEAFASDTHPSISFDHTLWPKGGTIYALFNSETDFTLNITIPMGTLEFTGSVASAEFANLKNGALLYLATDTFRSDSAVVYDSTAHTLTGSDIDDGEKFVQWYYSIECKSGVVALPESLYDGKHKAEFSVYNTANPVYFYIGGEA